MIRRVTTDRQVTEHEFPTEDINDTLHALIGEKCFLYERVRPKRLYIELGHPSDYYSDISVTMLVDEEGIYHELKENPFASWLYETDKHGWPIWGDVLFIGESAVEDGIDFCDMCEATVEKLKEQVKEFNKKRSAALPKQRI